MGIELPEQVEDKVFVGGSALCGLYNALSPVDNRD